MTTQSRRKFLSNATLATAGVAMAATARIDSAPAPTKKAQIAISLDLEMARNFPHWEDTHWDYEKGNLNDATKQYAVEAARRVKSHGGTVHFFLVCRALEQENIDWLREIIKEGHAIGSHTYDHVYLLATRPEEIQYRFQRAPWLIAGKSCAEVIRENIALATAALKSRLGIAPAGFRAPGGFADGLSKRPDIQKMLLDLGFSWVSTRYPAHPNSTTGSALTNDILDGIVNAQTDAQPFTYPNGLMEIPMNPISDIGAFRNGRWSLDQFLKSTRLNIEWAIERRAVFDFLSHPAVLSAMDPEFRVIELICELVKRSPEKAELVNLSQIYDRERSAAR